MENPTIVREVLEKANTTGTTSVDAIFLFFVSFVAFLDLDDSGEIKIHSI